jgi:hypothetical protein
MIEKGGELLDPRDEVQRYLLALIDRYKVSNSFLKVVVPQITEIFSFDIHREQREALLGLAEKSFKLQAETEAILRDACEMVGYLRPYGSAGVISRRRSPVTRKTASSGQGTAPAKARAAF